MPVASWGHPPSPGDALLLSVVARHRPPFADVGDGDRVRGTPSNWPQGRSTTVWSDRCAWRLRSSASAGFHPGVRRVTSHSGVGVWSVRLRSSPSMRRSGRCVRYTPGRGCRRGRRGSPGRSAGSTRPAAARSSAASRRPCRKASVVTMMNLRTRTSPSTISGLSGHLSDDVGDKHPSCVWGRAPPAARQARA